MAPTKPTQEITALTLVHSDRKMKRERERLSRQRRADKIKQMRRTVDHLERIIVSARTLNENDAVWEDFLDETTRNMRQSLLQCMRLTKEAHMLQSERTCLQHLLDEHLFSTAAIVNVLNERFQDNWDAKVAYYHELADHHFEPWTLEACQEEIDAALKEVNTFQWSTDKQTANATVFGWRELRRFDAVRRTFQFEFYKDYHGLDMINCVNATWDAFSHRETYLETIQCNRRWSSFEVLQQVTPNIVIARIHDQCPGVIGEIHTVYLVARVPTASGYVQCFRSVSCPELFRVLMGPSSVWPTNKIWFQWDRLNDNNLDYVFRIGGTMKAPDINYGHNWMLQVFSTILRIERLGTGIQLVTSD